MRRFVFFSTLVMAFAVVAPAAAACPAPEPQLTVEFHRYFTTANTPLTVPDPGVFTPGAMPSCPWTYTQTFDFATDQPSGAISNVHNDPSALGTAAQGGFTFTPAFGFVGTAYFSAVSLENEFITQYSFITVTAPGGGSDPGGPVASTKDDCKGSGWETVTRSDGSTFKNQGDCISYVSNGK